MFYIIMRAEWKKEGVLVLQYNIIIVII